MVVWKNISHPFKLSKYSYLSTAANSFPSKIDEILTRKKEETTTKSEELTITKKPDKLINGNDSNIITKKDITHNESTKLLQNPDESITYTTILNIIDPSTQKKWPLFSILNIDGELLPNATVPIIEKDLMLKMYKMMTRIQVLDDVFFNAQRQGRFSFYMQNTGEEAIHIGICMYV